MREHKYRAWDKKTKQMVVVVAIVYSDFQIESGCDDNLGDPVVDEGIWINIGNECFIEEPRDFKDVELMEYTSLKDKNGKERYEGDIIKFQYNTGYSKETTKGIVKFGEYQAGHNDWGDIRALGFYVQQIDVCIGQEWNICCDEIEKGETIGNIYENHELMGAGQ